MKPALHHTRSGTAASRRQTSAAVRTFYVDPSGNDSLDGRTMATAWATLSKVSGSTFSAGDRILLKRGGLWRETLTLGQSGTSGARITIGAYGAGAAPVISGGTVRTGWTVHSGAVYKITLADPSWVMVNKRGAIEASSLAAITNGQWWWETTTLYYRSDAGNPDSIGLVMETPTRSRAIDLRSRSYVTVQNLAIECTVAGAELIYADTGIHISGADCYVIVEDCYMVGSGIFLGFGSRAIVRRVTNYDSYGAPVRVWGHAYATIEYCYFESTFMRENAIHASSTNASWPVSGGIVRYCRIISATKNHRGSPGANAKHMVNWGEQNNTSNTDGLYIGYNELSGGQGGISTPYVARSASKTVIENNYVHDIGALAGAGAGIYFDPSGSGPTAHVIARNNLIARSRQGIYAWGASKTNIELYNNTVVNCTECAIQVDNAIANFTVANNIFYGSPASGRKFHIEGTITTSNYNYIGPNQSNMIYYNGGFYETVADYKTGSGRDANSVTGTPNFSGGGVDRQAWKPTSSSPFYRTGSNTYGPSTDHNGTAFFNPKSMGAFEA